MTAEEAILTVELAASGRSLLGDDAKEKFRILAKLIHPDMVPQRLKARAEVAFCKLAAMHEDVAGKSPKTIAVIGKWAIGEPIAKGDIADLYHTTTPKMAGEYCFKIARNSADADLMEAENTSLRKLASTKSEFLKYIPTPIDYLEASGRFCNVLSITDNVSLHDVSQMFNGNMDFRHLVWIVNRCLSALGFVHTEGIIHGAVLPQHVMIDPESHGMTLVDWCYSVTAESAKPIPAIVKSSSMFYPPEIRSKNRPLLSADLYMLMASIKSATKHVPKRFTPLFDWCLAGSPLSRPMSAWDFQDRWRIAAKAEYGDPKFIPLVIPKM